MERPLSTAKLRPPTGLDRASRKVFLRVLGDTGATAERLAGAFMRREHYADLEDYFTAVGEVWGEQVAIDLIERLRAPEQFDWVTFLLEIPEPDFLTVIELGPGLAKGPYAQASLPQSLNKVCEGKGLPYRVYGIGGAMSVLWTGDAVTQEEVLSPALSALSDPRLERGPKGEFDAALVELRHGTPAAFKQAVAEACNAVESALKVLLIEHEVTLPATENLDKLLGACRDAKLFPPAVDGKGVPVEQIITGPGRFGNRRGRHGSGPVAHDVTREEAEAVVGAAAVALTFIARRLP